MTTVNISPTTYRWLEDRARERAETPDQLAEALLRQQLAPSHPYIHVVEKIGGSQAVIRGTRIPVSIVVGYLSLGETPESLVQNILPRLTLAQVYDALSYYDEHREEIDTELAENTEAHWRAQLQEQLGEEDYLRLTGQAR